MMPDTKVGVALLALSGFLMIGELATSPDSPLTRAFSKPAPIILPSQTPIALSPPPSPLSEKAHVLEGFLAKSLTFVPDETEFWSTPTATLLSGRGDCEDYALLFLYLIHAETGVKGNLVIVKYESPPSPVLHAEPEVEGIRYFRPVPPLKGKVVARLPYALAMRIAEESRPRGFTKLGYQNNHLTYNDEPLPR